MSNSDKGPIHVALLKFANLGEADKQEFVSEMNRFLLASAERMDLDMAPYFMGRFAKEPVRIFVDDAL